MCGRARLPTDYSEIRITVKFGSRFAAPNLQPSWNIAPTQDILAAVRDPESGGRQPVVMSWGLIPSWSKEPKMKYATFNARSDSLDKPTFRGAWKAGRRCLVITDGFYEWRKSDKAPFAIARSDGPLTVMAGLWETWKSPAGEIKNTATIITVDANEFMAPIHDRMPVILGEEDWPGWLGESPASMDEVKSLIRPYPSDKMKMWPVDKRVGNVRNNDAALAEPVVTLL
jgi:putative SOS response-associated peptidase YedK